MHALFERTDCVNLVADFVGAYSAQDANAILSNLTSPDLAADAYRHHTGRQANARLRKSIAANSSQASQYFESAKQADREVRPVLIYYGLLGLARSLILVRTGKAAAAQHGLTTQDWAAPLSKGSLLDLETKVTGGTFSDLANVLGPTQRTWVFSPPFPNRIGLEGSVAAVVEQESVTLGALLARMPQLRLACERTTGLPAATSACVPFILSPHKGKETQIDLLCPSASVGETLAEQKAQATEFWRLHGIDGPFMEVGQGMNHHFLVGGPYYHCRLAANPDSLLSRVGPLELDSKGHCYLSQPIGRLGRLHPMLRVVAIGHILASLARYYPFEWREALVGGLGNRTSPLVQQAIDVLVPEATRLWALQIEQPSDPWRM